jgi:membrane-bound lytic murein transglycosylase D
MRIIPTRSTYLPPEIKGKTKLYYVVKDGDNLGFIAEWYHVGLSDLRYWNDLYGNTIRVGQRIVVYVDPSKADSYSKVADMSFAGKQKPTGNIVPVRQAVTSVTADADSDYIVYTVQYGDTIWDIVKKFDNVTTTEILSLNNISNPGRLQPGQKLKIKKKS